MGLIYRLRLGRRAWLNLSRRGVSASARVGPLTVSSLGRFTLRLFRGLSYRK